MKYKKTIFNQLALLMLIGSILFFLGLYFFTGSGPWDVFAYLSVIFLVIMVLVFDFIVPLVMDIFRK